MKAVIGGRANKFLLDGRVPGICNKVVCEIITKLVAIFDSEVFRLPLQVIPILSVARNKASQLSKKWAVEFRRVHDSEIEIAALVCTLNRVLGGK